MLLSDVAIVLPDRFITCGTVRIENGLICEISETPNRQSNYTLYPGFIDMHGDMIELELEPRVKVDFPMDVALNALDMRLAAAGITTAYCRSFILSRCQGG